jgi:hypothetical protein
MLTIGRLFAEADAPGLRQTADTGGGRMTTIQEKCRQAAEKTGQTFYVVEENGRQRLMAAAEWCDTTKRLRPNIVYVWEVRDVN